MFFQSVDITERSLIDYTTPYTSDRSPFYFLGVSWRTAKLSFQRSKASSVETKGLKVWPSHFLDESGTNTHSNSAFKNDPRALDSCTEASIYKKKIDKGNLSFWVFRSEISRKRCIWEKNGKYIIALFLKELSNAAKFVFVWKNFFSPKFWKFIKNCRKILKNFRCGRKIDRSLYNHGIQIYLT